MTALLIFVATLILVIWQPRGLGIGTSASLGAAVALMTGVVDWQDIPIVWHIVWDATFTFVALIIISLLLDEAGFFRWAAMHVARWGRGNGHRLFVLVVLLGALISAVFANDGAALLLTPIVLAILLRLGISHAGAFAFVIATGFIADTASLPLVISNLVNIVSANYFDVGFDRYAQVMVPVNLVSIAATLLVLWLYFRSEIPDYDTTRLEDPARSIHDPLVFRAAFPLLALLLVALFVTAAMEIQLPTSLFAGTTALIFLALAGRWHRGGQGAVIPVRRTLKLAPWQIVIFSLGMYLVVYGLHKAGLTTLLSDWLTRLEAHGLVASSVGTGVFSALLSAVMNNMPMVLVGVLAIDHAQVSELTRELMMYANVIGCDLGPKFTPIGSLATLLWLHVLARKGEMISWGQYMKVGLILTPPVLLATLLALAWWLPLVSA